MHRLPGKILLFFANITHASLADRAFAFSTPGADGEVPDNPHSPLPHVKNVVIGSNSVAVAAALAEARKLGFTTTNLGSDLVGDAREVGRRLLAEAACAPVASPLHCFVGGGETTVRVTGTGKGGRNQEMALAAAQELAGGMGVAQQRELVFLSAGTDGQDGPTTAAGAVVDSATLARGQAAGRNVEDDLANNDSHSFLSATGDLVITGLTGRNVMDIQVVCVHDKSQ